LRSLLVRAVENRDFLPFLQRMQTGGNDPVAGFDPIRVWRTGFLGEVVLGAFKGKAAPEKGVEFSTGVYDSVLANCEIGDDALVYQVKLLSNYIVETKAVVAGCGTVAVTVFYPAVLWGHTGWDDDDGWHTPKHPRCGDAS